MHPPQHRPQKNRKKAEKELKKYAKTVSQAKNITLSIDKCMYGPEDSIPAYVKNVLTLKTDDYQNMKLTDFFEYVTMRYEADQSLWEAKNRLAHEDYDRLKNRLSEEDYNFLTVTLPCTERESTYPSDRVGNIPADFGGRYELPYPKLETLISFEWCVRYEPSDPDMTVGQRDRIILNVVHGMDAFVADTPKSTDISSTDYLKKMRSCLDRLILENSGRGPDMTVFQCMGPGSEF